MSDKEVSRGTAAVVALLLGGTAAVGGAQEEGPDLEFLEYLGSWEGPEEEEWVQFMSSAESEDSADEAPEGEAGGQDESTERDDES